MASEPRERLAARATHADGENVAKGLLDDAQDAAHVLGGEGEEYEVHRRLRDRIVILERRRHTVDDAGHRGHHLVLGAIVLHEVAKDEPLVLRAGHLLPVGLEDLLELGAHELMEPRHVLLVDEAV